MTAIETRGLTKRYGSETALAELDLTVESGEVFGFLGPNGAGKTTTIDLLLDFIRPTEGSATVLGYDAQEAADAVRDRVGILPDGFDLWERSSGYRHLEFALDSKGVDGDPDALLDRVNLDRADAERPVGDYSKGMYQRLAMAMALAGEPDLLILDEPSSGLDPHGIRTMQELIREEAARGTTVFFSSHILGQVSAVCDRVGILEEGELVTVDTIAGLRETAGVDSRLIIDADGRPDASAIDFGSIGGVVSADTEGDHLRVAYTDPAAKARVLHQLVENGTAVRDFDIVEPTLDDLFAAFTGSDGSRRPEDRADESESARVPDGPEPVISDGSGDPRVTGQGSDTATNGEEVDL